jgi:hypothetical protein
VRLGDGAEREHCAHDQRRHAEARHLFLLDSNRFSRRRDQ